jgi:hypothetical protein
MDLRSKSARSPNSKKSSSANCTGNYDGETLPKEKTAGHMTTPPYDFL